MDLTQFQLSLRQSKLAQGGQLMLIYNYSTMEVTPWDGSLSVGSVVIGTVDQGMGGSSAWKVDGSAVTQPVSIESLALVFDGAASPILYLGEAASGSAQNVAAWRITRYDTTAPTVIQTWAGGSTAFAYKWSDRLALSYS